MRCLISGVKGPVAHSAFGEDCVFVHKAITGSALWQARDRPGLQDSRRPFAESLVRAVPVFLSNQLTADCCLRKKDKISF